MNKFIGIGRVTKDIEKKVTQSGKSVVSFTLAIKRDKENSDFINCVSWNNTADFLSQYVSKGDLISIDGKVQTRSYDKQDGTKAYITEVITNAVNLLSKVQKEKSQNTSSNYYIDEINTDLTVDDSELPF